MNRQQRQIVLCTLLGKAFITKPVTAKNRFLTIPESEDENWLRYKAFLIDKRKTTTIKDGKRLLWRSSCDPMWDEIYHEFYSKSGKTIKMEILDGLYDEGLSIWFLDKGCFKQGKACLRTTCFGYEGNLIIERYFNEVGMPCSIQKERKTGRILFTEGGTKAFIGTIKHMVPQWMLYRLAEAYY
jgi:hypothetical protein